MGGESRGRYRKWSRGCCKSGQYRYIAREPNPREKNLWTEKSSLRCSQRACSGDVAYESAISRSGRGEIEKLRTGGMLYE